MPARSTAARHDTHIGSAHITVPKTPDLNAAAEHKRKRSDESDEIHQTFRNNNSIFSLYDLKDPALEGIRLDSSYGRVALYSKYWKAKGALLDNDNIFRPRKLEALYFFKQYEYMVERIDSFREHCKNLERRKERGSDDLPGVLIIGTPGIGESVWPLYPGEWLTAFLTGKTSFLNYYLALELSKGEPVIYIKQKTCYIFNRDCVYASKTVPHFGEGFLHILCLVDADVKNPAPDHLLHHSYPFLLMAASPRKENYSGWMKQRASGQNPKFVLNPPGEDELVKASVPLAFYLSLAHSPQSEDSGRIFHTSQ